MVWKGYRSWQNILQTLDKLNSLRIFFTNTTNSMFAKTSILPSLSKHIM